MAFTPKFIDLVKNSTTVQGTGTVTLGAALSGFTGFASACVTGDQFYYCIQGIDKPAEREVGRGTFQADGTISRDLALGGPLKNFTIGTKTIALVAAGEWYAKLETLANAPASSGGAPTPLFSAAAGSTIAAPVVAISSAGYSVNGVGEARYIQDAAVNAAYVTANPRTSFRAADGRGFKLCTEQRLTVEMFGAIPNDSSAGAKASNDVAIKTACEHRATSGSAYGSEIHAGPYAYYLGVTLEPEGAFRLVGHSSGHVGGGIAGTAQTRLITPINVCTLRIRANGTDGTGVLAGRVGASDSVIAGISLEQATMGTTATAHGVHMRGTARMEECSFVNIAGNAINIFADSTYADPVTAGAADEWRIINCFVHSCNGHGLYTGGNESNAGYSQGVVFHQVGGCAIFDSSYLPNAHYSPQITGYGNSGEKGIFHLGRLYQLVSPNPALGSTTTPGTNANVWLDLFSATAATALFPQWVSGTVYGLRLPFLIVNQSPIYGAYQENGANIGVSNGLLVGGIPSASNTTSRLGSHSSLGLTNTRGIARYRSNGGSTAPLSAAHIGDEEYVALGALDTANGEDGRSSILTYRISGAGGVPSEYFGLDWLNDRDIRWNAGGRTMATIGGIQTLIAYGRLTPVPGIFTLWDMALGDPVGGSGQRIIGARDVAPTSGYHAQGEFYFNIFNPGSGTLGWSCVTAGTPGTFTPVKFANPFVSGNWSDGTGIYIGDSISAFRLTNFSGQFYLQAGATGGGGGTLNMGGMLGSGVLDVNVTGSLKQAGNQVWHAGNLSAFGTSAAGYVPASGGGTANFLRADGSWAAPPVGTGTVTSASVVTANGLSGTVATATTTPAITLTLGAITPASVTATGAVSGSNLSGSNSGDQTISLTGDVTGSGTGSFVATIGANKVGFAKFVAASQAAFVGANAAGNFTELTPAASTALLSAMGGSNGTVAGAKGLVPAPAAADNVKFLRGDGSWVAVAGGAGTVTSVSVTTANGVSGSVATATSTPAITLTLGAITPTSVAATGTVAGSNLSGTNSGDQTITLTGDISGTGTGSFATAIAANKVTNAMLAQVATATFHGRITAATGNVETLTATQATSLLDAVTSTTKGLAPASGGGTANFLRADGSWAAPPVGTGTVTSASVVTANGISGSVATATTTPAITLTLGAITPASVAATGAITSASIAVTGAMTSSGGGVGYATGAGGTVTQITSRTTGVTLSKLSGAITLFSTTTTAGQTTTLTVTDSQVAATDTVLVSQKSGTGLYFCSVTAVATGSFNVSVYTPAAVATAEAPVLNFAVVKGVNA